MTTDTWPTAAPAAPERAREAKPRRAPGRRAVLAGAAALAALPAAAQELRERPALQETAPILFVHGNGGSAALWMPTMWRFESNFYSRSRLFAVDMRMPTARTNDAVREPGRSSVEEATVQLGQEIARVRRATGIERVALVGHGRAGNIIRNFLRLNPGQRIRAAILCATPARGMIVSETHLVGSEFNGAGRYLRTLNGMPGGVPPGVATFTLSSDGRDKWIQPDGRFLGLPDLPTGIDAASPQLPGATNVVLAGADHMECAVSPEAFAEMYRIIVGERATGTRIRPEVKPTLNGRVSAWEAGSPTNIGITGARVRVYPVEGATGKRLGPVWLDRLTASDGSWGPLEVDPDMPLEFEVVVRGYPVTHIYRPPFPRGSDAVHLRPYLRTAEDPREGALALVTRPRGLFDFARDKIVVGGQPVPGPPDIPSENTLRVAGPAAGTVVQVACNAERVAGLTWPIAEGHVSVIELAE